MSHGTQVPAVRLAHDIAAQFTYLPPDQGATAVANHIRLTWDPRMRKQLAAAIADGGEHNPLVIEAARQLQG